LCLSPIGLSAITKLAPAKMVGLMMGLWFLASSYGQYLAGLIGSWMAIPEDAVSGKLMPPAQSIVLYSGVFEMIAWVSIGCGLLLALLAPVLSRGMRGER
jgi:POT family proton-dependent oligopeptide transporter